MRKSIPKTLKNKVWDTYIGKDKGVGKCICCQSEIDSKHFDCGHITAVKHNGKNILENLRPICSVCNKSMGDENLFKFKEKYFPEKRGLIEKLVEENTRLVKNFFIDKILNL